MASHTPPDVVTSPVKPFTPTPAHAPLHALAGGSQGAAWRGRTQTWLDPAQPPEEADTEARVALVLGGRFARVTYASTCMGAPHVGEMTLGHDDDRYTIAWIDSFHTGTAVTPLVGERGAAGISCLGSYAAGDQRWGWRIAVSMPSRDELLIEEWNIPPGGQEERAITMRLSRA